MKTLLVKDYRILLTQKKSLLLILIIGIFMVLMTKEMDFLVGYIMMLSIMFSAGTVNYDELDGGMAYILTLPASRKTYAVEKYVLTFLNAVLCGGIIFVMYLVTKSFVDWGYGMGEMAAMMLGWIGGVMLAAAAMLPLYMKFSAEKRRIVIWIFVGIIMLISYGMEKITKIIAGEGEMNAVRELVMKLESMNPVILTGAAVVILMVCIAVSAFVSIGIMKKKEF
ncbi:MAG: ABC-2 transporter permease [Lachnospiraceae bacterium]|nr:ABC-2 transporter permease [Lachnospiraceae bacterium]